MQFDVLKSTQRSDHRDSPFSSPFIFVTHPRDFFPLLGTSHRHKMRLAVLASVSSPSPEQFLMADFVNTGFPAVFTSTPIGLVLSALPITLSRGISSFWWRRNRSSS